MLSFSFFDSNEWEVLSNEALKDKIKGLEADNDILINVNKNLKTVIKNNDVYISELETKVKYLESRNKDLTKLCDEEYDKNKCLDLAWKEKYNNLKKETDETIHALQKKCVNSQYGAASETRDGYISELENKIKELEDQNSVADRKKDYSISFLENRIKTLEEENNKMTERLNKIHDLIHGKE